MKAFSFVVLWWSIATPVHAQLLPVPSKQLLPAQIVPQSATPSYLPEISPYAPQVISPPAKRQFSPHGQNEHAAKNIVQVQAQSVDPDENGEHPALLTELPGPDRLFQRSPERAVFQRIIEENRQKGSKDEALFPEYKPIAKQAYMPGRRRLEWAQVVELVEPSYLCHDRLLFEQINFERYGWDLGIFQPAVSISNFWADCVMMPYHLAKRPFQNYDCSAGKCLPGDPTPFMLYPPEFSGTGLAGQAAAVAGILLIFP